MKKILIFILAIVILAFGTAICNFTGLGIDPFNAFGVAISDLLNMSLGTIILSLQMVLGIFIFILKRENIGVGTIIPIISFGYFLQFFNWLFQKYFEIQHNLLLNIIIFIVGMLIIAFGMSMYMACKLGMVPYDSLAFVISDRIKKSPALIRIILDSTVAIVAFILGGPINIGTVLLAFSIGPLIELYRKYIFHKMFREE